MKRVLGITLGCEGGKEFSFEHFEWLWATCWSWVCLPTDHFPRPVPAGCLSPGAGLLAAIPRLPCQLASGLVWAKGGTDQGLENESRGKARIWLPLPFLPLAVSPAAAMSALWTQLPPDRLVPVSSSSPLPSILVIQSPSFVPPV